MAIKDTDFHPEEDLQIGKGHGLLRKVNSMEYAINKAESLVRKKKYKEAFEILEQADKKNNPVASYALGTWYLHGTYVKKDAEKAIQYLNKASHNDVKEAFFDLAVCYEKGVGVKKDYQKAFENYLNASNLGDKDSLYEIVDAYTMA